LLRSIGRFDSRAAITGGATSRACSRLAELGACGTGFDASGNSCFPATGDDEAALRRLRALVEVLACFIAIYLKRF
jgi:hypothetical protein